MVAESNNQEHEDGDPADASSVAPPDSPRLTAVGRPIVRRRSSRPFWRSRTLRYGIALSASVAGVLLFLLASASSNTPLFERHYPLLLALNATAAGALLLIVVVLVVRLARRYRSGQFGTRMMARFAVSFGLMGLVPGALIYLVSFQFIGKSIESWFDVRVDSALEAGLSIGRSTLDAMLADLNNKARVVAYGLSEVSESQQGQALNRLRQQTGAPQALLFTANGRVLAEAVSGSDSQALEPSLPPASVLRQLRIARNYAAIENVLPEPAADEGSASKRPTKGVEDDTRGLRVRVVVPVPAQAFLFRPEAMYVQLVQDVPPQLAINAETVQNGMRDYQELSLSRTGLQKIYSVTLTLTLLLSICAALAVAFLLASWLIDPLLLLAEGTKAVAGGDYTPMRDISSNDELGTLMQSFNAMVRQLDDARGSVEANRAALVAANTYLESILANLSAGVLVFDDGFRLVTANNGAARILATSFAARLGHRFADPPVAGSSAGPGDGSLRALGSAIEASFADPATAGTDWQRQIELDVREGEEPLVILARGSRCPVGSGADRRDGHLVVFDDMTEVIAGQRSVAWAEVARRLAHEIKNPLTPIQLSAERLKMKLEKHVAPAEALVLERGVATIVNQVSAMKRMVDDFRDYARVPHASSQAVDLNALVTEVMTLYDVYADDPPALRAVPTNDVERVAARPLVTLGHDLPLILGDPTSLRQVIHNLVQNAQDATQEGQTPRIVIATSTVSARGRGSESSGYPMVRLSVSDNGSGFPAKILTRAFEPYVTTKARGTGLGLAVVKKIVDEHQARIELKNRDDGGAQVAIVFTRVVHQPAKVA
jgi:nitrogen fixation/metabolism regulation signal transduction histidine kinase